MIGTDDDKDEASVSSVLAAVSLSFVKQSPGVNNDAKQKRLLLE